MVLSDLPNDGSDAAAMLALGLVKFAQPGGAC